MSKLNKFELFALDMVFNLFPEDRSYEEIKELLLDLDREPGLFEKSPAYEHLWYCNIPSFLDHLVRLAIKKFNVTYLFENKKHFIKSVVYKFEYADFNPKSIDKRISEKFNVEFKCFYDDDIINLYKKSKTTYEEDLDIWNEEGRKEVFERLKKEIKNYIFPILDIRKITNKRFLPFPGFEDFVYRSNLDSLLEEITELLILTNEQKYIEF